MVKEVEYNKQMLYKPR